MHKDLLKMPQDLGDNLQLRWGTLQDADALAEFNIRLHTDNADEPELWLGLWTRDLMSGVHPTTSASDFTVVVDMSSGAIVSSQVLISQTWTYDGIPFKVGRPELVATDEAYRRRGLIRKQMAVAHVLSAQRGELVLGITGIPAYYRMFGYEMALNLGGGREFFWTRAGNDKPVDKETYTMRPATVDDTATLQMLYQEHCAQSLVARERNEAAWHYELSGASKGSIGALEAYLISDGRSQIVAYAALQQRGSAYQIREFGVVPGHSWRSVALFLTRELKRRAEESNKTRKKPLTHLSFPMDDTHPVIVALGPQLEKRRSPYAWYLRVPDIPAFIRHISPVLEKRLANSVVAGHTGTLRLNFFRDNMRILFNNGKIVEAACYEPAHVEDADALFPDLSFLQLLFGYRSLDELDSAFPDCYAQNAEAAVLLNTLFPRHPSWVNELD